MATVRTARESKKARQTKRRMRKISQIAMMVTGGLLALVAITTAATAFIVVPLANDDGVPKGWVDIANERPETIAMPVVYFDQRSDQCVTPMNWTERQFEYSRCGSWPASAFGLQQGLVQDVLGADGLPVPANSSPNSSVQLASQGVWGDNFYRWFHEVPGKSERVDGRTVTFRNIGGNIYQYGGSGIFPLDGYPFSDGDVSVNGHNFHFTMKMSIPFQVLATGDEIFEFEGDDDVWVFVNGKLVLDIGGVHEPITGRMAINKDGTITSSVTGGGNQTIDVGLTPGEVHWIDFFYAERNTTLANCKITISNMQWPITADPKVSAELMDGGLIQYTTSIKNYNPQRPLDIVGFASFLVEGTEFDRDNGLGFLPLSGDSLAYSWTPGDESSWINLDIAAPADDTGFMLSDVLTLSPEGLAGDTLYLRYYVQPTEENGELYNRVSYLTEDDGAFAVVSAGVGITWETVGPGMGGGDEDGEDPGDLEVLPPLGEMESTGGPLAPDTGFRQFTDVVTSRWSLLGTLGAFAISFAIFFPLRKYR